MLLGPPPEPVSIETVMARLAAGDTAAIFTLAENHGNRIAGAVRVHLRRCGVGSVHPEDLHGLVLDTCMELADVAPAWRPGGATPWRWADNRIRVLVARWVGIHADAIDDREAAVEAASAPWVAPCDDESLADVYARLTADKPLMRLFDEARVEAKLGDDDLWLLLRYRSQKAQGDPSPAHTIAPEFGISPQTMRKRISRSGQRLAAVVDREPRYAALVEFVLAS